ncbi:MAG: DMT family transporter [Bdellovibrionales bacterium]|nr:DMT family transporter [Bdellovibrionales bacterium]
MNVFLYILLACFWGCSFIAIKYVLEIFPPFFSAFLRTFLTVLFLSIYILYKKIPSPLKEIHIVLKWSFMGVFAFAIPWAALFWGEQFIQPSLAGMINSSVPIFALCISWFVIPQDKVSSVGIFGVMLGFVGIACIFLPTIESGQNMSLVGMIAMIIMSISYSINVVWTRKWGRKINLAWAIWIQTLTSSFLLLAVSLATHETYPSLHAIFEYPKSVLGILYLSFCSTTLAMIFFYHLIHQWGAVKASSVNYILPFIAIFVDYLVLDHLPTLYEWVGVVLIIAGLLLLHFYRVKKTA